MTHMPVELLTADVLNTIFLFMGGIFLLKFLLKIGSQKSKKYAAALGGAMIAYAIFHEGMEVIHGSYGFDSGYAETFVTSAISVIYLIAAISLRKEINLIVFSGAEIRKKKMRGDGKHGA